MTQGTLVSPDAQRLLQLVHDLMGEREGWPTFTAVDLEADRRLGIEDSQAALLAIPAEYLSRPWHRSGFTDRDEVRLTLPGVAACEGGTEDVALLERLIAWLVELERGDTGSAEEPLLATSKAFAEYLGLPPETFPEEDASAATDPVPGGEGLAQGTPSELAPPPPSEEVQAARATLSRVRLLAELLPTFWSGAGWTEPWNWHYAVDRRGLRPYRRVHGAEALLEVAAERHRASALGRAAPHPPTSAPEADQGTSVPGAGAELDVHLTLLREEIADASGDHVRAGRFDDAIFAAFRYVEHALQQRIQNPSIGNDLIKLAFLELAEPIRITGRGKDQDRLVELFGGALGLFKGDRSHKDRPLLPCRSRRECLRLLAHASSLLDLLDRDIAQAPTVLGYEHRQGNTLTLWVDRAGPEADVWLDASVRLDKLSFQPGTLVVDVTGVSPGEHEIHLVEGYRQGAAHTVWFTTEPGASSWHRVMEVNLPLYQDAQGLQQLDLAGVRLASLEAGVASERIFPTREAYQVGHYVTWHFSVEALGPVWVRDRVGGPLRKVWDTGTVFEGQPLAPAHPRQLMRISMEPAELLLRRGERAPLRVLAHYTDGTATWPERIESPEVVASNDKTAAFKNGAVNANGQGTAALRCVFDGRSAEAVVQVAAHATGAVTRLLTGLPPVAGIAWTPHGLVVSTRSRELWRTGKDGVYRLVAATPQVSPESTGTDTLAAREDGGLAARLSGLRQILVLHFNKQDADYRSSTLVTPDCPGNPMACAWQGEDLLVATHTGGVHRVAMDGSATQIAEVDGVPVQMIHVGDALLVLCAPGPETPPAERRSSLWRIPNGIGAGTDLLEGQRLTNLSGLAGKGDAVYLSDFHEGRVLHLPAHGGAAPRTVAEGLTNPGQLAVDAQGTLYVAEFGAGAVRRVLA